MSFTIAIVGRPHVGKSTLFKRLVGARRALVDDQPGVTRDRREGDGKLGDLSFRVIDTAGLENAASESLSGKIQAQTAKAVAQADAVLFLVDARSGEACALESYALCLGDPVAISAEHAEGLADLYDALRAALPRETQEPDEE